VALRIRAASLFFLAVAFAAAPAWTQEDLEPAEDSPMGISSIAKVGQIEITREQLRAEVNRLIPLTFYHSKVPEGRLRELELQARDSLIERALVHQDAIARKIAVSEEEILAEFQRTLTKAGPGFANLSKERSAALLQQYRPLVQRRILLDKNEARFEKSLPVIDEPLLRGRYGELREELVTAEEAHILHILVKVDPSSSKEQSDEIRAKMDAIVADLEGGAPFATVAGEHSEDIYAVNGGDMGFVTQDSFNLRKIGEAIFALQDGETSEVLASLYGFHVARRLATKPGRPLTFEEARADLLARVEIEVRDATRKTWLSRLREKHGVTIHPDFADPPPAKAPESEHP